MRSLLTAITFVACTTPLAAQSLEDLCRSIADIRVGEWAAYRAEMPRMGGGPMEMRLAIVGTEPVNGAAHYWYEMKMQAAQGDMIMQMLIPQWPFEPSEIAGMIMKSGDEPAMRMPDQMLGMMAERAGTSGGLIQGSLEECRQAEVVGTERVTVPAGTFETMHLRASGEWTGDVWVALEVPFRLVQMQSDEGEMVLVGYGDDATSSITETPQEMPGR